MHVWMTWLVLYSTRDEKNKNKTRSSFFHSSGKLANKLLQNCLKKDMNFVLYIFGAITSSKSNKIQRKWEIFGFWLNILRHSTVHHSGNWTKLDLSWILYVDLPSRWDFSINIQLKFLWNQSYQNPDTMSNNNSCNNDEELKRAIWYKM